MVNGRLAYGVTVTQQQLKNLVKFAFTGIIAEEGPEQKKRVKRSRQEFKKNSDVTDDGDHIDRENTKIIQAINEDRNMSWALDVLTQNMGITFRLNGACCSVNQPDKYFIGWTSKLFYSDGNTGSSPISMITHYEKFLINDFFRLYKDLGIVGSPEYLIIADACDWCT